MTAFIACGSGSGGDSASTAVGGGVAASPKDMNVGDAVYVNLSSGSGSVELPSTGTFRVLLQSHATDGLTNTVTLSGLSAAGKSLGLGNLQSDLTLDESELTDQGLLDNTLRDNDLYWSGQGVGTGMAKFLSSGKSVSKGVSSGTSIAISKNDTANFYVLTSLTDTTSCTQVTATAKYIGSEICIFIDNEILDENPADLPQSDIDTLGPIYDKQATNLISWLGGYSDIDGDGCAVALITSGVNKLPAGSGIVTGYQNSDDFSDYNASTNPCSNDREIVYILAPDSGGIHGTKVTNAFWNSNFAVSVFPHELAHLINHYQKVIVKGGSAETACLNEGISHWVEDAVGYNVENPSRYDLFLASPQSYAACGSTSLAGRGAIYLFLRYLYERSGKDKNFFKNLVQTTDRGYTNIVNAYPAKTDDFDSIAEFLRQWGVALAYTDSGVSTGTKFKYNGCTTDADTGNCEGVLLIGSASDNRGTILTGPSFGTYSGGSYSLKDASTRFFKISGNPSKISFSANSASKGYAIILRTE